MLPSRHSIRECFHRIFPWAKTQLRDSMFGNPYRMKLNDSPTNPKTGFLVSTSRSRKRATHNSFPTHHSMRSILFHPIFFSSLSCYRSGQERRSSSCGRFFEPGDGVKLLTRAPNKEDTTTLRSSVHEFFFFIFFSLLLRSGGGWRY